MDAIPRPIFLIGLPGVGKTTLGRAVSRRLGIPFIDLDEAIVADAGMSVPEIFAAEGEAGFRQRESRILSALCHERAIIACGGGTPCVPQNMQLMRRAGTTVWLCAPLQLLAQRIASQPGQRPMFCNTDIDSKLAELYDKRRQHYAKADVQFDASRLDSLPQIESSVSQFITQVL